MEAYTQRLVARIGSAHSRLCLGLDPRPDQIAQTHPSVEAFLREVIEQTAAHVAAYKPNIAYFEAMGSKGIQLLESVLEWIPNEVPVILDAKRSDIGETQSYYAKACFETWGVDAVTLNPWLGYDTIEPFLGYEGKGLYLLCVTSNPGAAAFAMREIDGEYQFERIQAMCARAAADPAAHADVGLVAGLTNLEPAVLDRLVDVPLLIPGLGAQGGNLGALAGSRTAPNVVNVSRGILFREPEKSFEEKAIDYKNRINEVMDPAPA